MEEKKTPQIDHDRVIANQVAGMPLEEAIFQDGYSAGVDFEKKRGKHGPAWVKASTFKYVPGAPYHAKDNLSKGAGKFDIYGQFIWGDGSVTLPRDFEGLLILDESGAAPSGEREVLQRIKDFNLSDIDAPVFTHTKEFAAHFSYFKGKLMDIMKPEGTAAGRGEDVWVDPFDFYNWLIENHWEEHSSGEYWHRSKDRHQWPPEETCEKNELISKFKQQKGK